MVNRDRLSIKKQRGTLGTFAGVFTPSILTILGIILFLRLGFVVGSAGLGRALLILCLANGISVLTSVSLSAIATNLKVKGGGDYYLISRTLGLEFGGAIGIVLFLAQSVSIAFYCIGFGEVTPRTRNGEQRFARRTTWETIGSRRSTTCVLQWPSCTPSARPRNTSTWWSSTTCNSFIRPTVRPTESSK